MTTFADREIAKGWNALQLASPKSLQFTAFDISVSQIDSRSAENPRTQNRPTLLHVSTIHM